VSKALNRVKRRMVEEERWKVGVAAERVVVGTLDVGLSDEAGSAAASVVAWVSTFPEPTIICTPTEGTPFTTTNSPRHEWLVRVLET
jgi:hypothetical protein